MIFVQSIQQWLNELIESPQIEKVIPNQHEQTARKLLEQGAVHEASIASEPSDEAINLIKTAINAREYTEAIILLKPLSIEELKLVKSYWLSHSRLLLSQSLLEEAQVAITSYLDYVVDDIDFHYLYVDLLREKREIRAAIEHAYSMQYYLYDMATKDHSIEYARQLSQLEIEKLVNQENWTALEIFCEDLLQLDPQHSAFYWFLAQAEYQQGLYEDALLNISFLLEGSNFEVKAKALQAEIEALLRVPTLVPLIKKGEHFIVEGYVNNSTVNLLLDTGASISMLSQEAFDELSQYNEIEYIKPLSLNTAGGVIEAGLYQVPSFTVGDFEVENMQFTVNSAFSSEDDGLLGMNFLRLFKFSIDQNQETLRLEKK